MTWADKLTSWTTDKGILRAIGGVVEAEKTEWLLWNPQSLYTEAYDPTMDKEFFEDSAAGVWDFVMGTYNS